MEKNTTTTAASTSTTTSTVNIFENAISMEKLEPRLELTTNKVYTGDVTIIR